MMFKKGHIPWNTGKKRPEISGEKHPRWIGGRCKDPRGYIKILKPEHPFCDRDGYVYEHRLVIEKQINRYLHNKNNVHHLNKNKSDNRIQNLILLSDLASHRRFERWGVVDIKEIIFDGRKIK